MYYYSMAGGTSPVGLAIARPTFSLNYLALYTVIYMLMSIALAALGFNTEKCYSHMSVRRQISVIFTCFTRRARETPLSLGWTTPTSECLPIIIESKCDVQCFFIIPVHWLKLKMEDMRV